MFILLIRFCFYSLPCYVHFILILLVHTADNTNCYLLLCKLHVIFSVWSSTIKLNNNDVSPVKQKEIHIVKSKIFKWLFMKKKERENWESSVCSLIKDVSLDEIWHSLSSSFEPRSCCSPPSGGSDTLSLLLRLHQHAAGALCTHHLSPCPL